MKKRHPAAKTAGCLLPLKPNARPRLGELGKRGDRRVKRRYGANRLLAHEQLTPNLRRRMLKEPPRVGIALQQRVQIGIEIHTLTS